MTDLQIADRKALLLIGERHRTISVRVMEPDGPAKVNVFYFHRYGGHSLEFVGPAQALLAAGCRVICPEMLGHADSEWLAAEEYRLGYATETAVSLLQEYADLPTAVIGNDWGGHVALRASASAGDRVVGVFLFDFTHAVRFATDILMPIEQEAATLTSDSREDLQRQINELVQGLGAAGKLIALHLNRRLRAVNGVFATYIDPNAWTPFSRDPFRAIGSHDAAHAQKCDVFVVNGMFTTVKNLQMHAEARAMQSAGFHHIASRRMGYFEWSNTGGADGILEFLRRRKYLDAADDA